MVFSKRELEGYLMIDHRDSPGLTREQVGTDALGPGKLYESATFTCSHCQTVVVINPRRTRERGYCPKCDHYICDACEAKRVQSGGACRTFRQMAEEFLEAQDKGKVLLPWHDVSSR